MDGQAIPDLPKGDVGCINRDPIMNSVLPSFDGARKGFYNSNF